MVKTTYVCDKCGAESSSSKSIRFMKSFYDGSNGIPTTLMDGEFCDACVNELSDILRKFAPGCMREATVDNN